MTGSATGKQTYLRITLKKGREASTFRFHPWIFSGAIQSINGNPANGEIVEVFSSSGSYLATGHYENSSLAVKMLSFEKGKIDREFWVRKLYNARKLRQATGLTNNPLTNSYRLVSTEGDGLPGLIIDFYNGVAVLQAQTQGMFDASHQLAEALEDVYKKELTAVYDKSSDSFFEAGTQKNYPDRFLYGSAENPVVILENGLKFQVDFIKGQKTGFFLDQRENRQLLSRYAEGRKVLNLFSYTGGFSVYALKAGAQHVVSVDSAPSAIELATGNVKLNFSDDSRHSGVVADVKKFLPQIPADFDLVILDPPAFAKHMDSKHRAVQGYKSLNEAVLSKISTGGILFTFSCSQVVGTEMFESAVMAAAIETGRKVRILHRLVQPPDHPVSIYHPEGMYLKGLVLYVE